MEVCSSNSIKEDISSSTKKKLMVQLEKLLKSHDYYFVYADDSRSYNKGRDEQEEIEKLVKKIDTQDGKKDALKLVKFLMDSGIKTYLLEMTDKDPSELGFKRFWKIAEEAKPFKFSDVVKGRLYA